MIGFLAQGWSLLEHDESVFVSLSHAWREAFGEDPRFDEQTGATLGLHFPGRRNAERCMVITRTAGDEATRQAIRLLKLRYNLEHVRLIARAPSDAAHYPPASTPNDWEPDLEERPYDLTAVTVWPYEPEHPVRDSIVLELADQPGHYVHRARQDRRVLWCLPTDRVSDALSLPFPEAAHAWIRSNGGEDGPLIPRWRTAVLAEQDQSDAKTRGRL